MGSSAGACIPNTFEIEKSVGWLGKSLQVYEESLARELQSASLAGVLEVGVWGLGVLK